MLCSSILPSTSLPVASLSLVSISILPENSNSSNSSSNTSNNEIPLPKSIQQNSRSSSRSNSNSTSNSKNLNVFSISPSLKSAYQCKRATSLKKKRSIPKISSSFDTTIDNTPLSKSLSISSISSLDSSSKHPLLILDASINNNDDDDILAHDIDDVDDSDTDTSDDSYYSYEHNNMLYYPKSNCINIDDNITITTATTTTTTTITTKHSFDDEPVKLSNDQINDKYSSFLNNTNSTSTSASTSTSNNFSFKQFLNSSSSFSTSFKELTKNRLNLIVDKEVPLETFSQRLETIHESSINDIHSLNNPMLSDELEKFLPIHFQGKTKRIRENRTNPDYLLQYSLDNSARNKHLIQCIPDFEIDIFDDLLLEKYLELSEYFDYPSNNQIFDEDFYWRLKSRLQIYDCSKTFNDKYINDLKLSSISRYKLYSTITLSPRVDDLPNINTITNNIYPSTSIIQLDKYPKPWLNINDLKLNGKKLLNKTLKPAGLLKGSNIQYVSKNCLSKRWVCLNSDQI